tara:strand:+ start:4878 stop:5066 length:189 start_codon:yes stop_codon:yes gene_type:complete
MNTPKTIQTLTSSINYEISAIQDATRDGDHPISKAKAIDLLTTLERALEKINADIKKDEAEL